ncbi:hypothetical protein [Mycobacterium simiae]|nr:hypothetical protein [Mycobacterium simiae]
MHRLGRHPMRAEREFGDGGCTGSETQIGHPDPLSADSVTGVGAPW